jgi:hypothetical protein
MASKINIRKVELDVQGQCFDFEMCHRPADLGGVEIHQLWMKKKTLYGRRPEHAANTRSILDAFWAICREKGDTTDPGSMESFLMAKLLPLSFPNAARNIVPDGSFRPRSQALCGGAQVGAERALEDLLGKSDRRKLLTLVEFARQTADYLGIPNLTDTQRAVYEKVCANLFDDAKEVLPRAPDAAVRQMLKRWEPFRHRWRRRMDPEEKLVMAVLSYECRAAFHYCYSEVWERLLSECGPLQQAFELTDADLAFLRLWHVQPVWDAKERSDARFYPFHGHVFALHPALSLLIGTSRGRKLLGEYAAAMPHKDDQRAWGPILQASEFAIHVYLDWQERVAESRKKITTIDPSSADSGTKVKRRPKSSGRSAKLTGRQGPAPMSVRAMRTTLNKYAEDQGICCSFCSGCLECASAQQPTERDEQVLIAKFKCATCKRPTTLRLEL